MQKIRAGGSELLPEVFIIESLRPDDELFGRYEGKILYDILTMAEKRPKYYYFQHVGELEPVAMLFAASGYRYLHISVHGTENEVGVGELMIPYEDFFYPFRRSFSSKRLFFSGCSLGNEQFIGAADAVDKSITSIAAPCDPIQFDISAAFWAAFYVCSFDDAYHGLRNDLIRDKIRDLCKVFGVDFLLASRTESGREMEIDILPESDRC